MVETSVIVGYGAGKKGYLHLRLLLASLEIHVVIAKHSLQQRRLAKTTPAINDNELSLARVYGTMKPLLLLYSVNKLHIQKMIF